MNEVRMGAELLLPIWGTSNKCIEKCKHRIGKVVYIHPEGRFFMAQFDIDENGYKTTLRECYLIDQSYMRNQKILKELYGEVNERSLR